jgi:hypothetical protein
MRIRQPDLGGQLSTDTSDPEHYLLSVDPESADYLRQFGSVSEPDLKHINQFSGSGFWSFRIRMRNLFVRVQIFATSLGLFIFEESCKCTFKKE